MSVKEHDNSLFSPPKRAGENAPPRLALGAMNFGKRTSQAESENIVAYALEQGITFFDTANAYNDGESERILGRSLKARRASCTIATKVGMNRAGGRPEGLSKQAVGRACEDSLRRLSTDVIDLYYLHVPDHQVPIEETLEAISLLLEKGKIRAWGVSNYASWQILEMNAICAKNGFAKPVVAQQIYNALIRELEIEYFKFARRYPIHTTIYNPLAGGLLTGKHKREAIPQGSRFAINKMYQGRYWTESMFRGVFSLQGVADRFGMPLLDLAYAFVAARKDVDSILLGPASVTHLKEAIFAIKRPISPDCLAEIDVVSKSLAGTDTHYVR